MKKHFQRYTDYQKSYIDSEVKNGAIRSIEAKTELETPDTIEPQEEATQTPSVTAAKSVATKKVTLGKSLGNDKNSTKK